MNDQDSRDPPDAVRERTSAASGEPSATPPQASDDGGARSPKPVRYDQPTVISHRPPMGVTPTLRPGTGRPEEGALEIGTRLGHFELEQYVGGGGMGAVYRALDTTLNRVVAVKILSQQQAVDEETVLRFRNEAQSAARLDHENIARVFFVGEDQGLHYIVFEFIEGTNVRDLVHQRGPLPLDEAISYTLQVAEALVHASGRNVVHRDIKPSNVLVTAQGRAKLVDMGLARLHKVAGVGDELTASGVTLGTFDYISPEQARDPRSADVRSDVYSLGCTLYYMLTARPPFPDGTVLQKLLQHQGDAPPDPAQFNPSVPAEISRVVLKMLAKGPLDRYQTPGELEIELLAAAKSLGIEPRPIAAPIVVASQVESRWSFERQLPWLAPLAMLIVIVILVDLWSAPERDPLGPKPQGSGRAPQIAKLDGRHDVADAAHKATSNVAPSASERAPAGSRQTDKGHSTATTADRARRRDGSTSAASTSKSALPQVSGTPSGTNSEGLIPPRAASAVDDRAVEPPANSTLGAGSNLPPAPLNDGQFQPIQTPAAAPDLRALPNTVRFDDGSVVSASAPASDEAVRDDANVSESGQGAAADRQTPPGFFVPAIPPAKSPLAGERIPSTGTLTATPPGILVVDDLAAAGHYATLRAACAAAKSGDVVELRFDGHREEMPLELTNADLTIRAAAGFQPVVVFHPTEPDPLRYPRSMIAVAGGRLALVNVHLELALPRHVSAERWCLFEARQVEQLRLEKCTLTIRNASDLQAAFHPDVAFLRVPGVPVSDTTVITANSPAEKPVEIQLEHCVARGEAVFLRTEGLQPLSLNWRNGLLAISERFLVAAGSQTGPPDDPRIQIDLRHLTAVMRGGLCMLTNTRDAPYLLNTDIHCVNSVLFADTAAPLIEHRGVDRAERLQERVKWDGNWNLYEGFGAYFRISPEDGVSGEVEELDWRKWRSFWNAGHEIWGNAAWKQLPSAERPLHTHTPVEYELDERRSARTAAANDGRLMGFEFELLPSVPPPVDDGSGERDPQPRFDSPR